jgi:3,4-dihydroxyphenylacetate 2,3-dioxygenase
MIMVDIDKGLIAAAVAAHVPSLGSEATTPDFQRGLVQGLRDMGTAIRAMKPDVLVIESAHWVSTFNWFATVQNPHRGICVASEALELIPGTPYERKGDPVFANALIDAFRPHNVPALPNASEHYSWDYAGLVPLLYLDPKCELAVVQIPTVLSADHDECRLAGRLVDEAARATGKRVIFIASSALTHAVLRGRHNWPTPERMALDRKFIDMLSAGKLEQIDAWFPEYTAAVKSEMGGRVIATLLGAVHALAAAGRKVLGKQYGEYTQSSGSGNVNLLLAPA